MESREYDPNRDKYVQSELRKSDAANADFASVDYDKDRYAMLMQSGTALSQMSDPEYNYIKRTYTPTYTTKYKDNVVDNYLMSVGLPPSADLNKYRNNYVTYASGGGLKDNYGSMTDDEWDLIKKRWSKDWEYSFTDEDKRRQALGLAPTSYDSMYGDTLLDDELKENNLPPVKLLEKYGSYAVGGGLNENYGNLSDEDWKKIRELWSDDWEYTISREDIIRQANGMPPEAYDSMYEDTLLDDELKAKGLPPAKLLQGKVGTAYNAYLHEADDYYNFMSEVLRKYYDVKDNLGSEKNISGALGKFAERYTLEDAYNETITDPKWSEFASKHNHGPEYDIPEEDDEKYLVYDKNEITGQKVQRLDENGNPVYDKEAWWKDVQKAQKQNNEIASDEFSLSFGALEKFNAENGVALRAYVAAENDMERMDAKTAADPLVLQSKYADYYQAFAINDGNGVTAEMLYPGFEFTPDELAELQPLIDKGNQILYEQGLDAANQYFNGGQYQADIKQMNDSKIVAVMRKQFGDVPGFDDKTDAEVLHQYYKNLGEPYGMSEDEITKLENGEITLQSYMSEKCKTPEEALAYAKQMTTASLEKLGLPTTQDELNAAYNARKDVDWYIDTIRQGAGFGDVDVSLLRMTDEEFEKWFADYEADYSAWYEEEKATNYTGEDGEVYEEDLKYLDDEYNEELTTLNTKKADLARHRDEIRKIDPTMYAENTLTSREIKEYADGFYNRELLNEVDCLSYTADFAQKTADMNYINQRFQQIVNSDNVRGMTLEEQSQYYNYATDEEKKNLVYFVDYQNANLGKDKEYMSYRAQEYYKSLLKTWDAQKRSDKRNEHPYWLAESDSGFWRVIGAIGNTIADIPGTIVEGVLNLGVDTVKTVAGKENLSSSRISYFSDTQSNIAAEIAKTTKVGAFAYNLVPSLIQSYALVKTGRLGAAAKTIGLLLMSSQAYSQGVDEALQNGASSKDAYLYGLFCGFNEYVFEEISVDHYLKNEHILTAAMRDAMKSGSYSTKFKAALSFLGTLGKRGFSHGSVEALEEVNTELANNIAGSLVLGFDSSYNKTVEHYVASGMDREKAEDLAGKEVIDSVLLSAAGGFISGFLMTAGDDLIMSRGGRVYMDETGIMNFMNRTHNLSLISPEAGVSIATQTLEKDANGKYTAESATKTFETLKERGADASTMFKVFSKLFNEDNSSPETRAPIETMISEQRAVDKSRLLSAAERYVYNKTLNQESGMRRGRTDVKQADVRRVVNDYVDDLTSRLSRLDIRQIQQAAKDMQTEFIEKMDETAKRRDNVVAGVKILGDYFSSLSSDEQAVVQQGAERFKAKFNEAGIDGSQAAMYAMRAATIEHALANGDTLTGLNSLFGTSARVVPQAVTNAILNESGISAKMFIDRVCAGVAMCGSQSTSHLFEASRNGVNPVAYISAQMALARSMPSTAMSRGVYDHIMKYGAYAEALDLLTAANIVDTQSAFDKHMLNRSVRVGNSLMTSEEIRQAVADYNKAVQRYNDKLKIAESHRQADMQARATEDARIAGQQTVVDTVQQQLNETQGGDEKIVHALTEAINALQTLKNGRANLVAEQNKRMASTQADLAEAKAAYDNAVAKYNRLMVRHAASYVQRFGSQLKSMLAGDSVTDTELKRLTAQVMYGTAEDLNNVEQRIIAAEKTAAVALGRALGVDVECVEFNDDFFERYSVTNSDPTRRGCKIGGKVFLNTAVMTADVGSLTDEVLLHEVGHVIEHAADKNYRKYAKFAVDYFKNVDGADTVNAWLKSLTDNGLSQKDADKELVAEFARQVALSDPRAVAALCKAAPKMSMQIFQWLTNTKNSMTKVAAAQTRLVDKAQREFAKNLRAAAAEAKRSPYATADGQNVTSANRTEMDNAIRELATRMSDESLKTEPNTQGKPQAVAQPQFMNEYDGNKTSYDITKPFEDQAYDMVNNRLPNSMSGLIIGTATDELQKIGAARLPIVFKRGHATYNSGQREYVARGKSESYNNDKLDHVFVNENDPPAVKAKKLDAISEAIKHPVAIISSRGTSSNPGALVMILDVKSTNGKQAIAALELDGTATLNGRVVDAHVVNSVYGAERALDLLSEAFQSEYNGGKNVFFWDEKKVDALKANPRLQLPSGLPSSPYPHNIHDDGVFVKYRFDNHTESQQFKEWLGKDAVDSFDDVVYKDGEWFYKNNDGQIKSAEKNAGTYDRDFGVYWYTEYDPTAFNAKEHDAEYMELAKKHRAGTATHEDIIKLRSLVNAQALHQGVMSDDFHEPLDLYHGTPDFGFTEFDPTRPGSNGNLYTSTDPAVANGYAGVAEKESDAPLTREVSSALDPRLRDEYLDNLSANGLARRANAIIPGAKISVSFTRGNYTTEDEFTDDVTGKKYDRELLYHDMRYAALDSMSEDELLRYAAQVLPNKLIAESSDPNFEYQDMNNFGEPMNREDIIEYMLDEMGKGIYHLHGFAGDNQYRTDADETIWEDINDEMGETSDDIGENARNSGFTSTRIDNVIDPSGDYPGSDNVADDVIFYEPWQLKSADLVTVDDDGDIIPLSQRFDKKNSDIRYYTEYDPQTQAISQSIESATREQKTLAGDPRIIGTDNGFFVARQFSREGFKAGNPSVNTRIRDIAMIAPVSEFVNGDVWRTVPVEKCTAVVMPNTGEYTSMRADAREAGANVYEYDPTNPQLFDNAIDRAAEMSRVEYFPTVGYDEWLKQYKAIPQGRSPRVENRPVPRQTTDENRVSWAARTAVESPVTTDETYQQKIPTWLANGTGTYTPVSNAKTLEKARGAIARSGSLKQAAHDLHHDVAEGNGKATDMLARAEVLYAEMQNDNTLSLLEQEQIFGDLCMIASDAGRALQLTSELKRMTPDGHIAYMEQVGKRMSAQHEKRTGRRTNLTLTEEEKNAYRNATDEDQRKAIDKEVAKRFADETSDLSLLDRIRNWRYFAMLGNPRTHFRNMVGNTLMVPIARLKDTINTAYQLADVARGKMTADDRTTTFFTNVDDITKAYVAEQLKKALPTMQSASSKYIEEATKIAQTDGEISDSKLKEIWAKLRADVPTTHITEGKNAFGRFINALSSFNTNALELEDALYLGLRFKSSMYQQIQARGLDVNSLTEEQQTQIVNYAMQEALRATFRDASALADALNRFARTNKATEFFTESVIPFKKTPINIAKRSIEYSPLGLIQGTYKMISNNKQYKQTIENIENDNRLTDKERAQQKADAENTYKAQRVAAIDRLAAGTTGSIAFIIGSIAASLGWISIGRKEDEKDQFVASMGRNNYSLNIGDVSIDLSAFSPAAVPLLMGTALYNVIGGEHEDGEPVVSGLISALAESVDPITEMSMLSGIADALSGSSYSNNDEGKNTRWFGTIAGNAIESYVGQFVPTFVGQTARVFDPYARSYTAGDDYWASKIFGSEVGSAVKSLQNKVGLGWLSEPKVDLHGEPVRNHTNAGEWVLNALNNWVLPATIKFDRKNEIDDELVRLYGVVDTSDIFPTKPSRTIGSYTDKTGKKYTFKLDNDREYMEYQKEVGQTTYDLLNDLMQSMDYQRMTDDEKAEAVAKVIDQAQSATKKRWKARMIEEIE